jgi:hypothetical protein
MAAESIESKLTIVTTTHLIPSAPSVWILRKTIRSLRNSMPVSGCEHRIYYDAPAALDARHYGYLENLTKLSNELGLTLIVRPGSGLKANYLHAVDTVQTPYMLFLEHDWIYRRKVDLPRLINIFDNKPFVNYVKFNKNANDSRVRWDHFVEPEDRIEELPLTRTSCWSNNPHVVRLSKWRESWKAVVGEHEEKGAAGIEEKLYWAYGKGIFTDGFRETHAHWGCMIYGAESDQAMLHHINGSLSQSAYLEPFAKLGRLVKRSVHRLSGIAA